MTTIIYIDLKSQTYQFIESDNYQSALSRYLLVTAKTKLILILDSLTEGLVYKCQDYALYYQDLYERFSKLITTGALTAGRLLRFEV